jgi:hypothetical protein
MDLTPYLAGSGERILKGVTGKVHDGKGQITIAKAAVVGVDHNLIRLLMLVVDELGIAMSLNSLDTGEHVPASRHYDGRAADCNLIGAKGGPLMAATLANRYAVRYAEYLGQHGCRHYERGPWGSVLLGPVHTSLNQTGASHTGHIHTSVYRLPGAPAEADGHPQELFASPEGEEEVEEKRDRGDSLSSPSRLQPHPFSRFAFPPPLSAAGRRAS